MTRNRKGPAIARRGSLGREIASALVFKAAALAVLYFAFFGPSHSTRLTPAQVAAALLPLAPIHGSR